MVQRITRKGLANHTAVSVVSVNKDGGEIDGRLYFRPDEVNEGGRYVLRGTGGEEIALNNGDVIYIPDRVGRKQPYKIDISEQEKL